MEVPECRSCLSLVKGNESQKLMLTASIELEETSNALTEQRDRLHSYAVHEASPVTEFAHEVTVARGEALFAQQEAVTSASDIRNTWRGELSTQRSELDSSVNDG